MASLPLSGVFTALVTPFSADGSVDWQAYEALCERQIAGGVAGLVPVGTTGESPTLTTEEKQRAVSEAIRVARGRCLVYAGTGSNSTADSVAMTRWAKAAGADGCLVVTPYYNKPSQVRRGDGGRMPVGALWWAQVDEGLPVGAALLGAGGQEVAARPSPPPPPPPFHRRA